MRETAVGGVGLLLLVEWPVARVLHAETRGDDEYFAHGLFRACLQNHAADGGIDRQTRELTAEGRELAGHGCWVMSDGLNRAAGFAAFPITHHR